MKGVRSFACLSIPRRISLFLPVLLLAVTLVVGIVRIAPDRLHGLRQFALLAIAGGLVAHAVPALRACHRIEIRERSATFVRQLSQVVVPAGSATELAPSIWLPSTLSLRARSGVVALPSTFDGFTEVIAAIREQNPSAKIRGCQRWLPSRPSGRSSGPDPR